MTSRGTVLSWHDDEGWGVIDAPDAPGGCWAHVGAVLVDGYRALAVGTPVEVVVEPADQDGYAFRAVEVWPVGQAPVRSEASPGPGGYRSELTISFDDPT